MEQTPVCSTEGAVGISGNRESLDDPTSQIQPSRKLSSEQGGNGHHFYSLWYDRDGTTSTSRSQGGGHSTTRPLSWFKAFSGWFKKWVVKNNARLVGSLTDFYSIEFHLLPAATNESDIECQRAEPYGEAFPCTTLRCWFVRLVDIKERMPFVRIEEVDWLDRRRPLNDIFLAGL